VSERRANLETRNAGADPRDRWGRPPLVELRATRLDQSRRGTGDGMQGRRINRQHGKPQRWDNAPNRKPARDRPGRRGVADRLVVPWKPRNAGGGKGPDFGCALEATKSPGIDRKVYQPQLPNVWRSQKELYGPTKGALSGVPVGRPVKPVGEPDALIGHVRFEERDVETGHGRAREAPADERAGSIGPP
jgi:hypothetical protein